MRVISEIVKNEFEKSYLTVDGVPFLYNAVQSWYPPEQDYGEYIRRAAEEGYKVFSFWLYWRHLEPVEGRFDPSIIQSVIDAAKKYDMRLDIVWAGTDFCDHLDPRFAPDWVLNRHEWHLKDVQGKCVRADGYDMGVCCAFDPCCGELFEKENAIVRKLFEYIRDNDAAHRVIMVQVENEINIQRYHGIKAKVLEYIDRLAATIKETYGIAARVNIIGKEMDFDLDALKNIDAQGLDTYDSRISVTRRAMLDMRNSKMKYIAENAAYENSTGHIITSLVYGGFYNIYRIDHDTTWDKPGVYGKGWSVMPHTVRIKNLNDAMNKAGKVIAASPREKMVDFNCELDTGAFEKYEARKQLSGHNISFRTKDGSAAMVVEEKGKFYCFADGKGVFKLDEGEETEYITGECLILEILL